MAGVVVVVAVAAVVAVVLGRKSDSTGTVSSKSTTTTSAAPLVNRGALEGLLLSADAVNTAMGATKLASPNGPHAMANNDFQVKPTQCRVVHSIEAANYTGSGWTDSEQERLTEDPANHWVDQSVVRFSSAKGAADFVEDSVSKWSACASRTYTVTQSSGDTKDWTSGPVSHVLGTLSITSKGDGWSCQQALTAANNIVVNVQACDLGLTNGGVTMAGEIATSVTK